VFITSGEFSVAVECKMVKYQAVSDHNVILALHYLGLPVVRGGGTEVKTSIPST
jgi:hypothetical protein